MAATNRSDPGAAHPTIDEALLRHSSDAAIVVHPQLGVTYASPAVTHVLGIEPDAFVGRMAADWIHPDDVEEMVRHRAIAVVTGHAGPILIRGRYADSEWRYYEAEWWVPASDAGLEGTILHLRDVSERETALAVAVRDEARLEALLREASEVVIVTDADDRPPRYVSPSLTRLLGFTPEDFYRMTPDELCHPDFLPRWHEAVRNVLRMPGAREEIEVRGLHGDGTWRWIKVTMVNRLEDPAVGGIVVHCHDFTDRREAEIELARRALHDDLTGLPNRTLLLDRLTTALGRAQRTGRPVALLYCDIDNFKHVNDTVGHRAGDEVIIEIAARLKREVRSGDTAARLHGDEFVICIEDVEDHAAALQVAARIRDALAQPYTAAGSELLITSSLGVAFAVGSEDPDLVLEQADAAMYLAKGDGRDRIAVYDQQARARELSQLALRQSLRRAIAQDELVVHDQAIYDLATGRVAGTEALVRWNHPDRGLIGPSEFIPIAEESGAIVDLGIWVMRKALAQAREWGFGTRRTMTMWVNVAARQLMRAEFAEEVTAAIAAAGIPTSAVGIEITESTLIESQPELPARLAGIRRLGCAIAIDDFGTGYSSLLYLRRYAANTLKIDRSFVSGLDSSPDDTAIVTALRDLARMLELRIVAEGVETPAQLEALREMGCDSASGFLLARPSPAAEVEPLLDTTYLPLRSARTA
ncbi:MAG: putative bifunctional diguanylate cyclase/phosphodiesterase [Actinomycetota bacterium]